MKMIQDWLGHSDMSTTANIYSHIDSSSKLASANTIGEVLGEAVERENSMLSGTIIDEQGVKK